MITYAWLIVGPLLAVVLGALAVLGLAIGLLVSLAQPSHAQTPRYGISPFPPGYVSKPDAPPKTCTEPQITTMADVDGAAKKICR